MSDSGEDDPLWLVTALVPLAWPKPPLFTKGNILPSSTPMTSAQTIKKIVPSLEIAWHMHEHHKLHIMTKNFHVNGSPAIIFDTERQQIDPPIPL